MIPQRLQISGFLSYLEPAILDFTSIDLACISGSNGAGKSSLLDAITWVLFGQARKNNDAIINSKAKQAEVILEFLYENNRYRVQRIKPRDKTGQLDFHIHAGEVGWRPLTESSIRQTDELIRSTLRMDYDTFINASFFLQGKADQFAQQKASERKRILSTILGLEVWEDYQKAAGEQRRLKETEQRSLQDRLTEIDSELAQEPERRRRLALVEEQLAQITARRKEQEKTLETVRKLVTAVEEQKRTVALLEKQARQAIESLQTLEGQITQRRNERDRYTALLADEAGIRADHAAWQTARQALEKWNTLAGQFHQLTTRRAAHQLAVETARTKLETELTNLQNQQKSVQADASQIPEIEQKITDLQRQEQQLSVALDNRSIILVEVQQLIQEISDLNAEKATLKTRMDEIKKRISGLAEASGSLCPLCGQPLSAAERERMLHDLNEEGKALGDRFREITNVLLPALQQQRSEKDTEMDRLARAEQDLRSIQNQISRLQANLLNLQNQIQTWESAGATQLQKITQILDSKAYAESDQSSLAELDVQLSALGYDARAHEAARQDEQSGRSSESRLQEVEKAHASLQPLESMLGDLNTQQEKQQLEVETHQAEAERARQHLQTLTAGQPDLNEAENHFYALQEEENRLRTQVGAAMQTVNVLDNLKVRREQIISQRTDISLQITRLRNLERAFSKDGVPALLIAQALPQIEAQANDILDRISGGGMSVRFDTQRAYADTKREDKKETLDIIISDAAGPREYELFSGGEAFRVNFAIRLALSRVLAQRAGARLQTLVIDEGFGSQDTEGRQRLIEAINLVRPEFARILVITHLEEMKDAFPARIEVEKTPHGSQVSVITT